MLNTAAAGVADGRYDAIVTAPIQKSLLNDAGIHFTGHTEFFRDYFGCDEVVMMLATEGLRVALATTHLPLRHVSDAISEDSLTRQFTIIDKALRQFYGIEKPRIAMLGLNPHAGEDGHLGREEIEVLIPAQKTALANGLDVSLPIPADTAFVSPEVKTADIVLAMFHDQGLPVLKTQGFGSSVNITLGLPIIRTSVDHGTALDRAGQGNASCQSMISAIKEAISCARHIQLGR
jgi:4-hydroxythreonine-4-phosphate dehydrogenase